MGASMLFSINRWLPVRFRSVDDHAEALRIRIFLILISLCIVSLSGLFLILSGLSFLDYGDYSQQVAAVGIIVVAQGVCLGYFLTSGNVNLCSLVYATSIFVLIGISALSTGGWHSPACIFMLALPVIACLVVSRKVGIFFSLAVLVLYGIFYWLAERGYVADQLIPLPYIPYVSTGMWLTTLLFIVGCLFLFDLSTEDLSRVIQEERKLWQREVDVDELTGVLNAKTFLETADRVGCQANQSDRAIIYIRINNLKNVNQDFGFEAGDYLLRTVTERIQAAITLPAMVSRYTPDSFAIFISPIEDVGVFISNIFSLKNSLKKQIFFRDEILLICQWQAGAVITADPLLPTYDLAGLAMAQSAANQKQIYERK